MKSRVWMYEDECYDDLDDTDHLIAPVIEVLGLRGEICDNSAHLMIDHFTSWALGELFFTCAEVAWRCGCTFVKRQFRRATVILSGNEVIISRDNAQKLLDALAHDRSRAHYERPAQSGLLQVLADLRAALWEDDD